jgi:hypothetical protein
LTPLLNDLALKSEYLNNLQMSLYVSRGATAGAPSLVPDLFKLQMLTVEFSVGLGGGLHWAKAAVPFCDE